MRTVLLPGLAAAGLLLAWGPVRSGYFQRRAELRDQVKRLHDDLELYRRGREDHAAVRRSLDGWGDRTLGGDLETVDLRLRNHLNRLGEDLKLEGLSVGTGPTRQLQTPARSQFSRGLRELRDELDFIELGAWISGQGSLEQALRLVQAVDAEPWIKRLDQVRVQPHDNGTRCTVTVRLTTVFMPGRAPAREPEAPLDAAAFEPYQALAALNPFAVPAAPPPVQPVVAAAPPGPPQFPYEKWVITGVVEGFDGAEVWLLNGASGEARRLVIGQGIGDLTLSQAAGERAVFTRGDERYAVTIGTRLCDGRPD